MTVSGQLRAVACATGLVCAVAVLSAAGTALASTTNADKPDLTPNLPGVPYANQVAPVYVDTFDQPGHVLYRFDAEIVNQGGTLDLYRAPNGHAMQAIWPGGIPTQLTSGGYVDPNNPPTDPNATYEDLTALHGASFVYSSAQGHNHWHFQAAARYVLNLPGGGTRNSAKVGFCMADANPTYFPYGQTNGGAQTFCAPGNPAATFVRMGISRGTYDLYNSQVADQWVDVTGLVPGSYTLTGTVDPQGYLDESSKSNNTQTVTRTIPGATAANATATTATGAAVSIPLSGTIVGPAVPARQSASCAPKSGVYSCYVTTASSGRLQFAAGNAPVHGTVSYTSGGSLSGSATYTPAAGFTGADSFTYTTTDPRGLASLPATVTVTVGNGAPSAPVNTVPPAVSGTAQSGQTLTASSGSWSANPTPTYRYQWLRCDSAGNACASIQNATATTYTQTATDVGSTLRVTVTATNSAGNAAATSTQTAQVTTAQASGFPTTPILDTFNRPGPDPGSNWTTLFSGESKFSLANQQATAPASTYAAAAWNATTFGPNVETYATMSNDVGINLFARITNPGTTSLSGYSIEFHPNLSAIDIYRISNGSYSGPLGGAITTTFSRGARAGMQIVGSTISAWLDTGTGWKLISTRTDSTFTQPGYIGAELYGGTNRTFDDLGGGTAG